MVPNRLNIGVDFIGADFEDHLSRGGSFAIRVHVPAARELHEPS